MTREEAHNYARLGKQTTGLTIFDIDEIIDKIYDNFEKQLSSNSEQLNCKSCLNCKYLRNKISDTEIACSYYNCFFVISGFKYCGCWESKK